MMKHRYMIILLTAAIVAGGCSERVEKQPDNLAQIGFSAAAVTSRGTAVTTPALLAAAGGFDVWAFSHSGSWSSVPAKTPLLEEVAVTSDDNGATWSYGLPVEWPANSDNVSFFAYSPSGAGTVTYDTDGTPLVAYTVASVPAQQEDLLLADQLYDQHGVDYFPSIRKVDLYFRHALSQVGFSACYTGTVSSTVKLTGIVLRNVYYKGQAAMTTPVTWTLDTQTADYTLAAGSELKDIALNDTPQDVVATGHMLYLMPQAIGRTTDPVEMEVTFDIDGGELSYTSPVALPANWEAGKSYKYQITLDDGAIRVIVIEDDITMTDWSNSIILQTVVLTSDQSRDLSSINTALTVLNGMNTGNFANYLCLGIYGVNDVNHDMVIDIGAIGLDNFTKAGQYLLFDFKKTIRNWGVDSNNDPWTISLTNYSSDWTLAPAQQNLAPDATSGATLPVGEVSDAITKRGTILLKKQ